MATDVVVEESSNGVEYSETVWLVRLHYACVKSCPCQLMRSSAGHSSRTHPRRDDAWKCQ